MKTDPVLVLYRSAAVLIVSALLIVLLAKLPVDPDRRGRFEAERLHRGLASAAARQDVNEILACSMVVRGESLVHMAQQFDELGPIGERGPKRSNCTVEIATAGMFYSAVITGEFGAPIRAQSIRVSWVSVLPAIVALALAVMLRRLVISLLIGVALGALFLGIDGKSLGWLNGATLGTLDVFKHVMTDQFHFWIFLFTFSLIGLVNVATASGGMAGVANWLRKLARGERSTQFATMLVGLAIFFDDYSNTVVVGGSMRPLTDKARISREKLAYIVDSTAAPLAGLALISTWIGYEVSLIDGAMRELQISGSAYAMFLSTLPFRFYCIMTIGFLMLNIAMNREFGPMLKAQMRALENGELIRPGSQPLSGSSEVKPLGEPQARNALIPIGLVIFMTLFGMAANGAGIVGPWYVSGEAIANFDATRLLSLADNYIILCEDGAWVLAMASVGGSIVAVLLGIVSARAPVKPLLLSWLSAGRMLLLAFSILILAWAIGKVNTDLGTGAFLVSTLADNLSPWLVPILIFSLAAFTSFATGSSWSTMAILLPAAVPLAFHVGGVPFMVISVGAVLDGAIFGDHCSPLSDTTVMSSISSGCDHLDHVKTQLPYALTVGLVAIVFGYALAMLWNPTWSYIVAWLVFSLIFRLIGKAVVVKG